MDIALQLGHSNKVLGLFIRILDEYFVDSRNNRQDDSLGKEDLWKENSRKSRCFDGMVASWSDERILQILNYLKEWNTNSKHIYVTHVLLNAVVRVVKMEKLLSNFQSKEILSGLISYSERHYSRLDRLHESLYMLEYISGQLGLIPKSDIQESEDRIDNDSEIKTVHGRKQESGSGTKNKNKRVPVLFGPLNSQTKKAKKTIS